jgi:hypothetical protein
MPILRPLLVTAVLLLVLTGFVLPANAGKPSASGAATITALAPCSFKVEYTWSGFSGSGLEAEIVLGSHEEGGLDLIHAWTFIPNKAGDSGSASATFTLTGTPSTHEWFGFGQLFRSAGRTVRNSYAESDYLEQSCGPNVTVTVP